jgi:hypothetical protein
LIIVSLPVGTFIELLSLLLMLSVVITIHLCLLSYIINC